MAVSFNDLWDNLDQDKISLAMGELARQFETDGARECVYFACHRWLARDFESISIESIEQKQIVNGFKYVVDVTAKFNGKGEVKMQDGRSYRTRSFSNLKNKIAIIDWKTSKNTLDTGWVERYLESWQWRHYLAKTKADIFIYRGIRRRNYVNGDLETKEFFIHSSEDPNLYAASDHQIKLLKGQRDALIQLNTAPWPMNRPTACHKYGYDCPHIGDCYAGIFPKGELDIDHPMSYSRMEEFMMCPERARRNALATLKEIDEGDESESASFGNAVHRGLAEIYKQVFKV